MTTHRLKNWSDYRSEVRQFDAVLEHSKAVSHALVGRTVPSDSASYAEQVFVKALSHSLVLRQLAPDPDRRRQGELWDVPSISAVARCVIDAHDAFVYIASIGQPPEEASFRLLLWEAHDKTRRVRMLNAIGSNDPKLSDLSNDAKALTRQLLADPKYQGLRKDLQKKIANGDPPAYHLSQKEICAEAKVDHEYHLAVTMQLSQYVHTYPFAIRQMFNFKAGGLESLRLMALPLQFAMPFLSRITEGMRQLFSGETPAPPSRTAQTMALWRSISTLGVKSAALYLPNASSGVTGKPE